MYRLLILLLSVITWLPIAAAQTPQANTQQITDIAERQVFVPTNIQRIILGEGRFLTALSVIDPQIATTKIVGMLGEMQRYDPGTWEQFRRVMPNIEKIPVIGGKGANSFSVEKAIALKPDVAIFGLQKGHGPTLKNTSILEKLEAANIPVVFIDFRQKPLEHTTQSMAILGRLLSKTERAEQFNRLYQQALDQVLEPLSRIKTPKPKVFLHSRVGLFTECCETIAHQMFADFIDAAGGHNMGRDLLPGDHGMVNLEYLLANQPDIYIGTAIGHFQQKTSDVNTLISGAFISEDIVQRSLHKASQTRGFDYLNAIKQQRMHSIWHHFYISPFNVVAVQVMAKWFYPDTFAHLQPDALLTRFHQDFLPFDRDGVYWASLQPQQRQP
ncbi:MAG: iron ABC transporter substrate-binding protein [Kangiellaceae bacterium]|nr:iron ABC transporter substrate-binding protein [Kangiellaceae bacterium]|tara:strand:+ start:3221 stop:4375 length:1155 start_codon:yes stop_codon:yes gene_type:complete